MANLKEVIGTHIFASNDLAAPGDFYWLPNQDGVEHSALRYICPCGCGHDRSISIGSRGWQWDGNVDRPTLTPSILHTKHEGSRNCGWHGFLTAGVWKTC